MPNSTTPRFSLTSILIGLLIGALLGAALVWLLQSRATPAAGQPLFSLEGREYGAEQLPPALARQFYDLEAEQYQQRQGLAQQAALEMYLDREAEKRKLSREQLISELLPATPPTDAEIERFYAENESRINQPLPQVRNQIAQFLMNQRQIEQQQALIHRLEHEKDLQVLIPQPATPAAEIATEGRPAKGEPSAPITIVEFADYQCPHCQVAAATLDKLLEEHPERLQLVYMDFPINSSGISRKVAEGSYCALQQEQFWPYHSLAFARQSELNADSPRAIAQQLELDLEQFERCLGSEEARQWVSKSERQAIELGVRGTPAIFINGQRYQGHDLEQSLEQAVLNAVQKP